MAASSLSAAGAPPYGASGPPPPPLLPPHDAGALDGRPHQPHAHTAATGADRGTAAGLPRPPASEPPSVASLAHGTPMPPAARGLGKPPAAAARRFAAAAPPASSSGGSNDIGGPKAASRSSSDDTMQSAPAGRDQRRHPRRQAPAVLLAGSRGSSNRGRMLSRLFAPPGAPAAAAPAARMPLHAGHSSSGSALSSAGGSGAASSVGSVSAGSSSASCKAPAPTRMGPLLTNLARLSYRRAQGSGSGSGSGAAAGAGAGSVRLPEPPAASAAGAGWASSSGSASVGMPGSSMQARRAPEGAPHPRMPGPGLPCGSIHAGGSLALACGSNSLGVGAGKAIYQVHVTPNTPAVEGLLAAADQALERVAEQLAVEPHPYAAHGAMLHAQDGGGGAATTLSVPNYDSFTYADTPGVRMPWDLPTPEGEEPEGQPLMAPQPLPMEASPESSMTERCVPLPAPPRAAGGGLAPPQGRPTKPRSAASGLAAARKLALAGLRLPWLHQRGATSTTSAAACAPQPPAVGPLTAGRPAVRAAAAAPQAAASLHSSCRSWSPPPGAGPPTASAGAARAGPAPALARGAALPAERGTFMHGLVPQQVGLPSVVVTTGWPAAALPQGMPRAPASAGVPDSGSVQGPATLAPPDDNGSSASLPFGGYDAAVAATARPWKPGTAALAFPWPRTAGTGPVPPRGAPAPAAGGDGLTPMAVAALYRLPMHLVGGDSGEGKPGLGGRSPQRRQLGETMPAKPLNRLRHCAPRRSTPHR
jgi:hypothetical protein